MLAWSMRHRLLFAGVLLLGALASPGLAAAQGITVAVVIDAQGFLTIGESDQNAGPFDWVGVDSRISAGPRSYAVLAFASGARYRVESRTRAHVQGNTVHRLHGMVTELPAVPAFPVRQIGRGRTAAEPTDADRAALKAFADAIGTTADKDLLLLATVVHLHWGMPKEAGLYLQRARAANAPKKLVEMLQRQLPS